MRSALVSVCLLLSVTTFAQPHTAVTITNATIFLNGAELASSVKLSLPAGESDVLFTNVAGNVNQQSLTIGAENGVVVQSATFQNNYLGDSALSPRAKMLRDSITILEFLKGPFEDRKSVIEEQLAILKENRKIAGTNTSLSVAELQKLLDVSATRTTALLAQSRDLEKQSEKLENRLALLRAQLDEEQKRSFTPGGSLLVKFYSPDATTTNVNMTYVVPNAGWTPSYDLRVEKVGDPVRLFYKANVYQNSGVKWNNVRLTLSTGNPNEGAEAPVLSPLYLAFYDPYAYSEGRVNTIQINRAQITKLSTRTTPDVAALNAQGYQAGGALAIGGTTSSGNKYIVDGVAVSNPQQNTINSYTSVDVTGINTTFDIDLPYSVPSDGQQHTVAIKTYELPASYRHFAVPRLDKDAFLQAQITKWEDLNLLPAATNVFFEGSYVGQGFIDMRSVRDTMNLSLGRDKKIIVRRERDKSFHSVKTIGTNQRQEVAYTISIRNTRKEPVNLVVMDQIPVSNDKDIVVEEPAAEESVMDETTGAARWTLELRPAELKKLRLSYIVKYPRGKAVAGL
jgi:hypothetical protein